MSWQPINTAKLNSDKPVLVFDGENISISWMGSERGWWPYANGTHAYGCYGSDVGPELIHPTHWMPLPEFPS